VIDIPIYALGQAEGVLLSDEGSGSGRESNLTKVPLHEGSAKPTPQPRGDDPTRGRPPSSWIG